MENNNSSESIDRPLIKIFWTGGWDSTFRVISLANKNVVIRPYFVIMYSEEQSSYELKSMISIAQALRSIDSTNCILEDPIIVNRSDVEPNPKITESYNNLYKKYRVPNQYEVLARIAENHQGMELGIERDGGTYKLMKKYGKLKYISDEMGGYHILDPALSDRELLNLFGFYRFPILEKSKIEMRKEAEAMGMIEIMNKTWFCRHPVNNKPCGFCSPCRQAIFKGMKYRFSSDALKRGRIKRLFYLLMYKLMIKNIVHGIDRIVKNIKY